MVSSSQILLEHHWQPFVDIKIYYLDDLLGIIMYYLRDYNKINTLWIAFCDNLLFNKWIISMIAFCFFFLWYIIYEFVQMHVTKINSLVDKGDMNVFLLIVTLNKIITSNYSLDLIHLHIETILKALELEVKKYFSPVITI